MGEVQTQELAAIRKELLEVRLILESLIGAVADHDRGRAFLAELPTHRDAREKSRKFNAEHPIFRCGIASRRAVNAIEAKLGDPMEETLTLEDIGRRSIARDDLASLDQVGPQALKALDGAMRNAGLNYAAEAVAA